MRLRKGALGLAAIAISLWPTISHANLIVNGDFGTGDFTGWMLFDTPGGDSGNPSVVSFDVTGGGASNAARFQVGGPGRPASGGGGIIQSISTGSGTGVFSADIAAFDPFSSQNNADGGTFNILFDGVSQAAFSVGNISSGSTVRSSLTFTLPLVAGTHNLEILITRDFINDSSTPYQYVTNVSFDAPAPPSVPEPSTLRLVGISVIFLAASAIRRGDLSFRLWAASPSQHAHGNYGRR